MNDWNPELYSKFLKDRTQPAIDLATRIDNNPTKIFDLGCGPGNSTAILAKTFPNAHITGGDLSPKMLEKAASNYPELEFIPFNAETDFKTLKKEYDLIFSNACIHWIPNHANLLSEMMNCLIPGGMLAVQIPNQKEHLINCIIENIAESPKWKPFMKKENLFFSLTKPEYFDILSELTDHFSIWEIVYCHRMPSHFSLVEWIKSTGMKPYLEQLPTNCRAAFETDVLSEICKAYPIQKNGEIMFYFPRLFFTAIKL